ncbi:MAG: mechanosensitive ion channel family protein [Alphaproteobacteria bacterium]|nr:mechanosensitive ion channel family protein [Alphaproteobacteria bacterium]
MDVDDLLERFPWLDAVLHQPPVRAAVVFAAFLVVAVVVDVIARWLLRRARDRWKLPVSERVVRRLTNLVAMSFVLAGIAYALVALEVPDPAVATARSVLLSLGVIAWGLQLFRIGTEVLNQAAHGQDSRSWLQSRTLPIFDVVWKGGVTLVTLYLFLTAWGVELTTWLASFGIAGIAVGFAAQETLSNLFAGVFILADAPYQLGDFLVLDDGTRGRVTEIRLRTTRLLTRDEVEIVMPNALMASARVQNESAGPSRRERVGVPVQVAYGSDLDKVREVLLEVGGRLAVFVRDDPRHGPMVRFKGFGDSGIDVTVFGWIADPAQKEDAVDQLVVAIHKGLREAGIEIPFPQVDLHHRSELVLRAPTEDPDADAP